MALDKLEDLFVEQLEDLYNAEQQIIKALPTMAKEATSSELQQAFNEHLQQTQTQAKRIEQIFHSLGNGKPKGEKCKGMEGIIDEGERVLHKRGNSSVIDAALIAAAQRVEHYEMAGYGCARTYAQELGYGDAANLLQQTLNEEAETNERLTGLAERAINLRAREGRPTM